MTIKKRLFCSNILMIAVPAAITALIGLVCLGLLWFILHGGGGMHLEDGEDFSRLGRSVTRQLQGCLAYDPDTTDYLSLLSHLNRELARRADLAVEVVCGLPLVR